MSKMVKIRVSKGILYLTEQEIYRNLPNELIIEALRRGKWAKRADQAAKRSQQRAEQEDGRLFREMRESRPW